jgi:hypothetical protein
MQILGSPGPAFDTRIIRTPDVITRAISSGQFAKTRTAIKDRNMEVFGEYQYPTKFFNTIGPTWNFLFALRMLLFHYDAKGDTVPKVFKDAVVIGKKSVGDDTEYYIRSATLESGNENIESFYEILLPSNAGYNPTLIRILEAPDKKPSMEYNISYVKLNGVYLPSNFQETHYNTDGMVTLYKQYTLKEQKINEVITEDTFTINNLGLKDGDRFVDKIASKEFTYQGDKLIESAKKSLPMAQAKKQLVVPDTNEPNQLP